MRKTTKVDKNGNVENICIQNKTKEVTLDVSGM